MINPMRLFILATSLFALPCSFAIGQEEALQNTLEGKKLTGFQFDLPPIQGASPNQLILSGSDDRQQITLTAFFDDGSALDLTRNLVLKADPQDIVQWDSSGRLTPLKNGTTTLFATTPQGWQAQLTIQVENFESVSKINFPNQIVPIFTKNGCNGGGCHGKSGGQNGFRLSLLGFEPSEDYEHLVKESRGRRIFTAAPDRSLLLLKGSAILPHGGGNRLDVASEDYEWVVRWIKQGMPYGEPNDPVVQSVSVYPKERTLLRDSKQQLIVTAHYSDGTTQDVTRGALYEVADKEMAEVSSSGLLTLNPRPGDISVMVRYQGHVDVFQGLVPFGAPVDQLPSSRNFIDELVFQKLTKMGLPPSDMADDTTFLRRVTLDIAGRLPTSNDAQAFLSDPNPKKRDLWIEKLLSSTDYAENFATKWSALLRNKRTRDTHRPGTQAFYSWIRDSLAENKPFDQFTREILAASGDLRSNPPVAWYREVNTTTEQMEDTAQLFLGTRLQCAQCHHHPFEKWSQKDYYQFSAFFSQIERKNSRQPDEIMVYHRRGQAAAKNKKNDERVFPTGLGSQTLDLSPDTDPRHALVDWMTDQGSPFFTQSLVNRYWKHFFGRGLVEPEDDIRATNPATNPLLLRTLAEDFKQSGYDLKHLVRLITQSTVYQLSALPNEYNLDDKQNFSRFYPKRLTAEVLLDSINQVTQSQNNFSNLPAGTRTLQLPDNSFNNESYFLTVFGRPESSSACECERTQEASLAQSLHLLNSKTVFEKLSHDNGQAALFGKSTEPQNDGDQIRHLYWQALSRPPTESEVKIGLDYLSEKSVNPEGKTLSGEELVTARRQAYEDIIWALLNTKEFLFNH